SVASPREWSWWKRASEAGGSWMSWWATPSRGSADARAVDRRSGGGYRLMARRRPQGEQGGAEGRPSAPGRPLGARVRLPAVDERNAPGGSRVGDRRRPRAWPLPRVRRRDGDESVPAPMLALRRV